MSQASKEQHKAQEPSNSNEKHPSQFYTLARRIIDKNKNKNK